MEPDEHTISPKLKNRLKELGFSATGHSALDELFELLPVELVYENRSEERLDVYSLFIYRCSRGGTVIWKVGYLEEADCIPYEGGIEEKKLSNALAKLLIILAEKKIINPNERNIERRSIEEEQGDLLMKIFDYYF